LQRSAALTTQLKPKGETTMSNDTTTATSSKRPTHTIYCVQDYQPKNGGGKKSEWLRIGIAWEHRDGNGHDGRLLATPIDGRIVIRKNKPKPAQA
jgi:hypothetical protein